MDFYIGVGIILVQDGKYVLIEEVRNEKKGLLNLPAGTLEIDEDLLGCVTREAEEETGVTVVPEYFIGVYQTVLKSGKNILFFVFSASIDDSVKFSSEEHKVIKAVTYDEIIAYDKAGKLRAPTIKQSIDDYIAGQRLPLSVVKTWNLDGLASITVDKDH